MTHSGTAIALATGRDAGKKYRAIAVNAERRDNEPHEGTGSDRESAIAKALQCSRIYYADTQVERDILVAEARGRQTVWLLQGETLHRLPQAA